MPTWLIAGALAFLYFSNEGHQPGVSPQGWAPLGGPPPQPPGKKTPAAPPALVDPSNPDAWLKTAWANREAIGDAAVDLFDLIRRDPPKANDPPGASPVFASGEGYEGAEEPMGPPSDEEARAAWNPDVDQDGPANASASWSWDQPDPWNQVDESPGGATTDVETENWT